MRESAAAEIVTAGSMSAATVLAPGEIGLESTEIPEPGENQVRIRLEGSGVCASNLAAWGGKPWFEYPFAPGALGHEGWGVIDALGPGVATVSIGQRVAALTEHAYAGFDIAVADQVFPLPPALDGRPFPGEPLGCAMNILRRSRIESCQTVAIVGIGFLGAVLTRLAANTGARVIAISRRPYSLEIARALGADEAIAMDDHWRIIERVKELTGGRLCERVIEAVGKQWPLDLAGAIAAERGTLVIAGYHQDGPRQVDMQLWNWRGIDVINAHERDPAMYARGIRDAIEAVTSNSLDPFPLFTHVYPLDRLGDALDATRDRPDGFMKALVVP